MFTDVLFSRLSLLHQEGHPNSSALLLLLPIGLVSVPWIIEGKQSWKAAITRLASRGRFWVTQMRSNIYASICMGLLTIASFVWISQFLREIVYRRLFVEYTDLNDLSSTWMKSNSGGWSWTLLLLLASIYVAIRWKGKIKQSVVLVLRRSVRTFVPFFIVGGFDSHHCDLGRLLFH